MENNCTLDSGKIVSIDEGMIKGHLREVARNLVEETLNSLLVRRIEDITEALWDTKVSPGTISHLNQKAYENIEAWRNRPIEGDYPYVYLDGIVLKRC